jgi:Tfp pilus assembly protein PilF
LALWGATDRTIALVDMVRGEEVARLPLRGTPVRFEPQGDALWTTGSEGLLRWPMHRGVAKPDRCLLGPPTLLARFATQEQVAVGADTQCVAFPNGYRGALLWQRDRNRTLTLGPQSDVRCCAVSSDGCWVATGSHDLWEGPGAKVWDAATGKHVANLPVGRYCAVGFSPDGKWLVTTGGETRLWEVGTWKEGPALRGSPHNVRFAFSADGKLLALGDVPGVVRLVVPDTGKEVARLPAPEQTRLHPCCFTLDGGRLITVGAESGAIHIFDLRAIRMQLQQLDLDWDWPPLPPASPEPLERMQVDIELGNFLQQARADDLVRNSNELLSDKKHAEALAVLRQAIEADPTHALAHNNLAWQLCVGPIELRNPKEALTAARKAVDLDGRALYLNTLGVALYRNDDYKEAVAVLEKSLATGKGEADAFDLFFLAMCHHCLGDGAKAQECYDGARKWMKNHDGTLSATWRAELSAFQTEAKCTLAQPVESGKD